MVMRHCGRPGRWLRCWSYLRGVGAVLPPRMPVPQTPADRLAVRFGEYLARERGLAGDSVRSYTGVARRFLAEAALGDDAARRA